MIEIARATPMPLPGLVSERPEEDGEASPAAFAVEGYCIVRGSVDAAICEAIVDAFDREIRPYPGPLLRQASTREEPHKLTRQGRVGNALLSIQDLDPAQFPRFRALVIGAITQAATREVLTALLGETPSVVESMYFESTTRGVPLHADSNYMDSSVPGTMIGAWLAIEDISPGAGRFSLIPRSHRLIDDPRTSAAMRSYTDAERHHMRTFKALDTFAQAASRREIGRKLDEVIKLGSLRVIAPCLRRGDALFWLSDVLHGSLEPTDPAATRHSITAHYVARSHGIRENDALIDPAYDDVDGVRVRRLRDVWR